MYQEMNEDAVLPTKLQAALNKLCKWRMVFAGWQLGTRTTGDPECDAVRDHREVTMLMRAEINALTKLCLDKGVFTVPQFQAQLLDDVEHLDKSYEEKFPGFKSSDTGMVMDIEKCKGTMKGWRP